MASNFLHTKWVNEMTNSLKLLHPELSEEELMTFVEREYQENFRDTNIKIYNSYEEITYNGTLGETLDWIQSFKPLIAESGVFFYPKDQMRNLNVEIIKECMLDARTIHKAEKFAALDAGDMFLASVKDIQQANDKVAANSGYGAEGQPSSFLFNMHSAMSVTSCGRGQLSTAAQCIENLLADNVKFFNMDEFFCYVNHIIAEKSEWKFNTFDVVDKVPSKEKFLNRFRSKFLHHTMCDDSDVERVYDALDDEMRIRVFYKANMIPFLKNYKLQRILTELMVTPCRFKSKNKDGSEKAPFFVDPNDVPDSLKDGLNLFMNLIMEFVNYKFGIIRYEDRMRYMKRAVIPVADTDSRIA